MQTLRYESSLAHLPAHPLPIIFLAGPTVRGNQPHLTSWRLAAIEEFQNQHFPGTLVIPEFTEKTESDKVKLWIPKWEFAGLCIADVILFWIPRTRELIGLTTNHEHGYWLARSPEKLVYGRPDDSYRNTYLDLMWHLHAQQQPTSLPSICTTLGETIRQSLALARKRPRHARTRSKIPVDSPYGPFTM
jgi:hypothetical protein